MAFNRLRKEDLSDLDIADSYELASDGYSSFSIYLTTPSVSITSSSKNVLISLASDGQGILNTYDHPVEANDLIRIYGTSGGLSDGYYTVNSVIDNLNFTVNETIASSTGGFVEYHYRPGALKIGFDPSTTSHITKKTVQGAIQDLDSAIASANFITKEIEIDFGASPTNYKVFTVYDSDVGVNSKLFPHQSGKAATGRSADENEMDPIIFAAQPAAGSFKLIASSLNGPVVGKFKVNYGIS